MLDRYTEVGVPFHPKKLGGFSSERTLLGYRLCANRLEIDPVRFGKLAATVCTLCHVGWARPREVERIVGQLIHCCLLVRLSMSAFSACYAYIAKWGNRSARLWSNVKAELQSVIGLLPLVYAALDRPTFPAILQSDASDSGLAVVYNRSTPEGVTASSWHAALHAEATRPRPGAGLGSTWTASSLLSNVERPSPDGWRVAVRKRFKPGSHAHREHINAQEMSGVVDAVRWLTRSREGRHTRVLIEIDSQAALGAVRKGRTSTQVMRRHLCRLSALSLLHGVQVEARWVPTDVNYADGPSRGSFAPGMGDPRISLLGVPLKDLRTSWPRRMRDAGAGCRAGPACVPAKRRIRVPSLRWCWPP